MPTHGRPQIEIPPWVPDEVKECIRNRIIRQIAA
jgi:hypothetical protein